MSEKDDEVVRPYVYYIKNSQTIFNLRFSKTINFGNIFYQDEEESPSETATLNRENVDEKSSDLQRYHEIHAVICSI